MKALLALALTFSVLAVGLADGTPSVAHGAAGAKKVCKTRTKTVHGAKKRVKVCHTVTATPTPTTTPTPAATATQAEPGQIDPTVFRLPASAFPPGSKIRVDQVESNAAAAANGLFLHFGPPWGEEGRLTGYGMVAAQPNPAKHGKKPLARIVYLVSIFSTGEQAFAALDHQVDDGWFQTDPDGGCYGRCMAMTDPSGASFSSVITETFFVRGLVLIEVWTLSPYAYVATLAAGAKAVADDLEQIALRVQGGSG
jgi:hypothetical protein